MLFSHLTLALTQEEQQRLEKLLDLSLEDVMEVETTLDDGFDVFAGTVKKVVAGQAQSTRIGPAVTTLITAHDIEAIGAHTLDEVLSRVPGFYVSKRSSNSSSEVLFLLNGTPLNGYFGLEPVIVENIARVEIIRGPGSALYGANGFAGVINIVTKTALEIGGTEVGFRRGSYDTTTSWLSHGRNFGKFQLATALAYSTTDGRQLDRLASLQAPDQLKAQLELSYRTWQLRLQALQNLGTSFEPWGSAHFFGSELTWQLAQSAWEMMMKLTSHHWATEWLYPPGAFGVIRSTQQQQWRGELTAAYMGLVDHQLRVGIGSFYTDFYKPTLLTGQPLVSDTPSDLNNGYAFGQDSWSFIDNWELTLGIRYDWYSNFGHITNPWLALMWQTRPDLTTKLLYGQTSRMPTFIRSPLLKGYPQLDTYELACNYQVNRDLHLNLNLFRYQANHKPLANYFEYRSLGIWKNPGVEFEAHWKLRQNASLLLNYTNNVLDSAGAGNHPHHLVYLQTDWLIANHWFLTSQVKHKDFDLTLRYHKSQRWYLAIGLRNLLNVREPDYPQAGRNWWAEIRYRF